MAFKGIDRFSPNSWVQYKDSCNQDVFRVGIVIGRCQYARESLVDVRLSNGKTQTFSVNDLFPVPKREESKQQRSIRAEVRPKWFCSKGKSHNNLFDLDKTKSKQSETLQTFRMHDNKGDCAKIHNDHFDWWMFPTEDQSRPAHNILEGDMERLKADESWMSNYRESVVLIAKAWGWNVENGKPLSSVSAPPKPISDVRLAKIIRSLWLFGQKDLMQGMQKLARHYKPDGGLKYGRISLDEVYNMQL